MSSCKASKGHPCDFEAIASFDESSYLQAIRAVFTLASLTSADGQFAALVETILSRSLACFMTRPKDRGLNQELSFLFGLAKPQPALPCSVILCDDGLS